MRARILIACLSISTMFATAQEAKHAPTLESCSADLSLWTARIPGWPNPTEGQQREGTKSLAVLEMLQRISYLDDCGAAYPDFNKSRPNKVSDITSLVMLYYIQTQERLFNFVDRHGLTKKFQEEDEAGKR